MHSYRPVVISVFHGHVLFELLRGLFLAGRSPHVFVAPLQLERLLAQQLLHSRLLQHSLLRSAGGFVIAAEGAQAPRCVCVGLGSTQAATPRDAARKKYATVGAGTDEIPLARRGSVRTNHKSY